MIDLLFIILEPTSRDSTTNTRLLASVNGVVQFYAIGRKGFKKKRTFFFFFFRIKDSTGERGDGEETNADEESIQFYSGNKAQPLFPNKPEVVKPKTAVTTLLQKDLASSSKVCSIRPFHVYHYATFLVDLEALPSTQDIKCDDVENWRNDSNDKLYFSVEWMDNNSAQMTAAESSDPDVATLKREYHMLKHDNDFKKKMDILFRE